MRPRASCSSFNKVFHYITVLEDCQLGRHRIFTYGSLMRGFGNNDLLNDSTFVGNALTEGRFTMIHLGGFPGVVAHGNTSIHGELWDVDEEVLDRLDQLEGHPDFYERTEIRVLRASPGTSPIPSEWEDAEVYLLPYKWLQDNHNRIIESGDWKQAAAGGRSPRSKGVS